MPDRLKIPPSRLSRQKKLQSAVVVSFSPNSRSRTEWRSMIFCGPMGFARFK
jgi:hypothetical protein